MTRLSSGCDGRRFGELGESQLPLEGRREREAIILDQPTVRS
jgi:hypothetical protein